MTPLRFGAIGQQLAGIYHPPHGTPTDTAVLLCPPFGQEAIRIHRFYRVLSERLARAGLAALRFDYFGTGDADGDDMDGDLDRWCADIQAADTELRARTGCQRTIWFGARLGGTLALMASKQAGPTPSRLVCWEPIIDGASYLKMLAQEHVKALQSSYRKPVAAATERPLGEALGFGMSERLMNNIARIGPGSAQGGSWRSEGHLTVIGHREDVTLRRWAQQSQGPDRPGEWRELSLQFEWTAEEAMNTALVPQAALQSMLSALREGAAP